MSEPDDAYRTMRAIGDPYGVTSHALGQMLKAEGYRSRDGSPTYEAQEKGLVEQYSLGYGRYAWKWHTPFVTNLLTTWLRDRPDDVLPKRRKGRR
jgi:hypothetical protein